MTIVFKNGLNGTTEWLDLAIASQVFDLAMDVIFLFNAFRYAAGEDVYTQRPSFRKRRNAKNETIYEDVNDIISDVSCYL